MIEQMILGVLSSAALLLVFVFLSASVAAVFRGPHRGPFFIQRMSYLYATKQALSLRLQAIG